jgi:MBG domain-containing protein
VIGASYSGAPGFNVSTAQPISIQVAPATPTITVSCPSPAFANGRKHPYACTAGVTGVGGASVSGSVVITYDGSPTAPFRMGTYAVLATFTSADPNYTNTVGTGTLAITHRVDDDSNDSD